MIPRPAADEHAPYYGLYVDQVPDGDILSLMDSELAATLAQLDSVPAALETHRYEPGKWSVRQVVSHMLDAERVFGYRALSFARLDPGPLPSMDQDLWVSNSNADRRELGALGREFAHARRTNLAMFQGLDAEMLSRRGIASDCEFTVRSIAFILVGHEIHHRKILAQRYLAP